MRRWIAERLDGTWHHDLPIDGAPSDELSGVGALSFTASPVQDGLIVGGDPIFLPWGTYLYLEEADQIRWGGVVTDTFTVGAELDVDAYGFATYPSGQPFTGTISDQVQVDPVDMIRAIWAHLQGFPDGDMGVQVVGSSSARIGTPLEDVEFETGAGEQVSFEAGPYRLDWFDWKDCGREVEQLVKEGSLEWVEEHAWADEAKTSVTHRILVADRIGRRADDLSFQEGVNLSLVPLEDSGDTYASEITGLGRGEGEGALTSTAAVVRPGRLRRARVLDSTKDIGAKSRLDAIVQAELRVAQRGSVPGDVTVYQHPHAVFETFHPGDEIRVDADADWLGPSSSWHRIVKRVRISDMEQRLTLEPA